MKEAYEYSCIPLAAHDRAIHQHISDLPSTLALPHCFQTLWNTRDTTVTLLDEDNSTFVITGDINDLWVRDSCAQVGGSLVLPSPPLASLGEGQRSPSTHMEWHAWILVPPETVDPLPHSRFIHISGSRLQTPRWLASSRA